MNLESISVVVTAFDQAPEIGRCLEGARGFGEVIVVDAFSSDGTLPAARPTASVIYQRPYASIPEQRDWGVARARYDWVLVLDAAEVVDDALRAEVRALDPGSRAGFRLARRAEYLGRIIRGGGWTDRVLRLYDRRRATASSSAAPWRSGVEIDGPVGGLDSPLRCRPYRDLSHHLDRLDAASDRAARAYLRRGGSAPVARMLYSPPLRFLREYLLRGGVRDGFPGFAWSLLSSYEVFLTYAKAWERGARA